MKIIENWDVRARAIGADTFFKIIIRRLPNETVWAWALEWNHAIRIVGFCGDEKIISSLLEKIPNLIFEIEYGQPDHWIRGRIEIPIADCDNNLFLDIIE